MAKAHVGIGAIIALSLAIAGCDKKPDSGGATASNLPVKGPWEAIKVTMIKKDPDGTAHFKVDNVGSKTVTQIYFDAYGYDAKGKQVIHKDLGFSLPIKGGASDDFIESPIKDVATWEIVYHGIGFEGDAKETLDYKRAPAQRAKGAP
ncbi:MAG: hypothetical protein ABJE95_10805 [Byssovorax sp.]